MRPWSVYVIYGRDSTLGDFFPPVFELSSLLPANGGDGSEGFVIPWVPPAYMVGANVSGAGDINNDGIGDIRPRRTSGVPRWPH